MADGKFYWAHCENCEKDMNRARINLKAAREDAIVHRYLNPTHTVTIRKTGGQVVRILTQEE